MARRSGSHDRRARLLLVGVAILVPLICILFSETRIGRRLEKAVYDLWFNYRGELPRPDEVSIVAIDVESEQSLGRYPWNRRLHAALIRNLARAGVKAVAFDATFGDAFPDDDPVLMAAIQESGITVLGAKTLSTRRRDAISRSLEEPVGVLKNAYYGIVDINPDPIDNVVREYPIQHRYRQRTVPQLGLQVLKLYLGFAESDTLTETRQGWYLGDRFIPRGPGGGMLISYLGFAGSIPTYSYASVVDDASTDIGDWDMDAFEDLLAEERLKDRIVFVGSTVPEHQDFWATPFLNEGSGGGAVLTPGVEIHANAVDAILNGRFVHVAPRWIDWLLILAVGVATATLAGRLKAKWGGVIGLVLIGVVTGTSLFSFVELRSWIWTVSPVLSVAMAYAGSTVALYLIELHEKARIRGMFSSYVSSKVVEQLILNPGLMALGGEERELTIMFSDVASFTTISEGLRPTELVGLLNEYLTAMTDIVIRHDGIIDKYEGDALMAEFGAPIPLPDHALRACQAALEMQETLAGLREKWTGEGKPALEARIGVNTGVVLVGNMGSRYVMDYTVMGDNVNLASRLEGTNKVYGTGICISEMTFNAASPEVACRELDLIRVKGKTRPVRIYEVLGTIEQGIPAGKASLIERFEMALVMYRERAFGDALDYFENILQVDPEDGPSRIYRQRCRAYLENPPPEDWDGVFIMTTK